MSITKLGKDDLDGYAAECDECGTELEGTHDSFEETITEMKNQNWKISKEGDEFRHQCPDCQEEDELNDFEEVEDD